MTRMNTTILVMLIQTMGQNILDSDEDEHNNLGHAHTNNGAEYSRQ